MNNLTLFFILNIFIGIYSCSTKPKLCINCKFFTKKLFSSNTYGKCTMFPREDLNHYQFDDYDFLVTGIKKDKEKKIEYDYCSVCRISENKCGKEGNLFEEK